MPPHAAAPAAQFEMRTIAAMKAIVISVDGACSGRRCACAAVAMRNGCLVAKGSRNLPEAGGYVLAAEIAAVALAGRLLRPDDATAAPIIVETDNPDVLRVIETLYRPRQANRLPAGILAEAITFARQHQVTLKLLPRNSTRGLQLAHRLASRHLWAHRERFTRD